MSKDSLSSASPAELLLLAVMGKRADKKAVNTELDRRRFNVREGKKPTAKAA